MLEGCRVRSNGKHPVGAAWQEHAEHDPERVRTMLGNSGVKSYGIVPPVGVLSWDLDSDARARLAKLEATFGQLPPRRGPIDRATASTSSISGPRPPRRPRRQPLRHRHAMGAGRYDRWGPGAVHASTGRLYAVGCDEPTLSFPRLGREQRGSGPTMRTPVGCRP